MATSEQDSRVQKDILYTSWELFTNIPGCIHGVYARNHQSEIVMAKQWVMVRLTREAHKELSAFRELCELELTRGRGDSLFPNRDDLVSLSGAIQELIRRDADHRTRAKNSGKKRQIKTSRAVSDNGAGQTMPAGQ